MNELRTEIDRNKAIETLFLGCGCSAEVFGWRMLDTAHTAITDLQEELDALEA